MNNYRKTKKYIKLILAISIFINVVLGIYIYVEKNQIKDSFPTIVFYGVQKNLVELEAAIWYQNEHDWAEPYAVTEKLDDVLEGINITLVSGDVAQALSDKQGETLRDLHYFLNKFPQDSGFPNKVLNESEIEQFKNLQEALRRAGWSSNANYSSEWESFYESTRRLIAR